MSKIKVKTLNQLLSEPPPKEYYLIKPLLPVGGMMLLIGDVKTFKSYLALNIGYSLSCGAPVLGRFTVPEPMSVLYIEMEVGVFETRERASIIHSYLADGVASENFHIVSKDMRIQLDTPEGISLIHEAMEQAKPRVLILDPIVEFHSQDENSAIKMKSMLWPLRGLLKEYDCSLIIVHHTAKPSEFRPGNNPTSSRGSYLAGAANSILNLEKPVKNRDDIVRVNFTTRSAKAPHPMTITFNEAKGGFDES